MNVEMAHPAYRRSVDGLRAAAILSVIGYHAFPAWFPGGFIGVDIFFVISGFLITGILLDSLQADQFSLTAFYARRIRRIFPALLLVLTVVICTGYFILWPGEYTRLGRHIAGGAGFVINYLLQHETGYFQDRAETKPLLHLWSLGVEEQFYIFWPLMLWAGWKIRHHAGAMIALVIAASFATNIWLIHQDAIIDFYSPFSRFWELLAGGALAWQVKQRRYAPAQNMREVFSIIGQGLIVGAVFHLNKNMDFPGWLALLPVGGAVLIIAAGEESVVNGRFLGNKIAVGIGLISYPLYLWHWPLLSFAHILSDDAPARSLRFGAVALAFLLAALTYFLVERPIRGRPPRAPLVLMLLGLMTVIGMAGGAIYVTGGIPSRFADKTAQALDTDLLIDGWKHSVRMHTCHLQNVEANQQTPECIEIKRPLLMLWGDSHAAALYPGLKALQENYSFGIAQLTQAGCPPIPALSKLVYRKNCNEINQRILGQVATLHPDVVMLSSAWSHRDYPMMDDAIVQGVQDIVKQIRQAAPRARIIIVGPTPRWQASLPAIYRRALSFQGQMPPARTNDHIDMHIMLLDKQMSDALAHSNVSYISLQQIICDASGCMTRTGPNLDSIAYVDEEHISPAVSERVVDQFSPVVIKALGLQKK